MLEYFADEKSNEYSASEKDVEARINGYKKELL